MTQKTTAARELPTQRLSPLEARRKSVGATATTTDSLLDLQRDAGNIAVSDSLRYSRRGPAYQRRIHPRVSVPPVVAALLANDVGRPLDAGASSELSAQFGRDLSDVRVHDDARAAASSRAVDAHAYAVGRHIVAPSGALDMNTIAGRALLAHEISHVVQQSAAGGVDPESASMEGEAQRSATSVLRGGLASVTRGSAGIGVARQQKETPHLSFYENALFANRFFGGPKGARLVPSGWPYDDKLRALWSAGSYNEFADVVREYQERVMGRRRQWRVPGQRQGVADGVVEAETAKSLLAKPITPKKEEAKKEKKTVPPPMIPKPPAGAATAKTPKEMYLHFIEAADVYGLPVAFLKKVGAAYDFELQPKDNEPETRPWTQTMKMHADTYEGINKLDPLGPIATADVDTTYHESTHALLTDLMKKDPAFKTFIAEGIKHYAKAPMVEASGGPAGETKDPERLFHEAAAEYVAGRASGWWSAFLSLAQYVSKRKLTDKVIVRLRKEYDDAMAQRVHGSYSERAPWSLSSREVKTTQAMSGAMKTFLDHELLEDKIPDHFDDVAGFKKLITESKAFEESQK